MISDLCYTLDEAARAAGMSRNTLMKYIKSGELKCVVYSPRLKRIRIAALNEFMERRELSEGASSSQAVSRAITPKYEAVEIIDGKRR